VFGDHEFADRISSTERAVRAASGPHEVEAARGELLAALTRRLFV